MSGMADALRQLIGKRIYLRESRYIEVAIGKNPYEISQDLQNYTIISEVGEDCFKGNTYRRDGKLISVGC